MEAANQIISFECNKLKDKEHFYMNEMLKYQTMVSQLELEKMNLENQIKSLEQNINQNEAFNQTNCTNNLLTDTTNRKLFI